MDEGGPESHSHAETSPSAPRGRAPAHDVPDSSAIVPTVPMGGGGGGGRSGARHFMPRHDGQGDAAAAINRPGGSPVGHEGRGV